jgi:hypothetical protein
VDLPTSASPNNKIVTSGLSAMVVHLSTSFLEVYVSHMTLKAKGLPVESR